MSNGIAGLWESIRGRADDPSLGYVGASMLPGVGEATDLVEIGAGLQDRDLGRIGLGITALALPFVGAAGLKTALKKLSPNKRLKELRKMRKSGVVTRWGESKLGSGRPYEQPRLISPAIRGKGNEVWIPHPEAIEKGGWVVEPFMEGHRTLTHGSIVSKGRGKVYDDIPDVVKENISSEQMAPRRTSPNVGYIDETGQFLNRKDAHRRAVVTGQIKDTGVDLESIQMQSLYGREAPPEWPPRFSDVSSPIQEPEPPGWGGVGGWQRRTPDDIQELRDILEDLPNEPSLRWSNRRLTSGPSERSTAKFGHGEGILAALDRAEKGRPLGSGEKYFSRKAMAQARGGSTSTGHYMDMDPETFLKLTGGEIDPEKLKRVKKLIEEGVSFESYPFLNYRKGPKTWVAEISGHEGRHRARALADLGVKKMPVRLHHVGSWEILQGKPDDYGGMWPRVLRSKKGTNFNKTGEDIEIPYPVSDPRKGEKYWGLAAGGLVGLRNYEEVRWR